MRHVEAIDETPQTEQPTRIVARYGQPVLRHREALRKATLVRDIDSLKLAIDFLVDELERDYDLAEESAILLLKRRVDEIEAHWEAVTLAVAARDLGESDAPTQPSIGQATAA
jgi:hypothetical protein